MERDAASSGLADGGALPEVLAHASGLARALCREPNDDADAAGPLALALKVEEAEVHAEPIAIAVAASDIEGKREADPEPLIAAAGEPAAAADVVSWAVPVLSGCRAADVAEEIPDKEDDSKGEALENALGEPK